MVRIIDRGFVAKAWVAVDSGGIVKLYIGMSLQVNWSSRNRVESVSYVCSQFLFLQQTEYRAYLC